MLSVSKSTAANGVTSLRLARTAIRERNALQRTVELMSLIGMVRRLRPRVIVEVGSYKGGTLFCWSRVAGEDACLISIDLHEGDQMRNYGYGKGDLHGLKAQLKPNQSLHCLEGNSQSQEMLERVKQLLRGRPVDFLFLDGDHAYTGVKTDFALYAPLVRPGGLIAFHDIRENPHMPDLEVHRLWRELVNSRHYRSHELLDPCESDSSGMGIGVLVQPQDEA